MKRLYYFYIFVFSSIIIIFLLYKKDFNLNGEVIQNKDLIVFYKNEDEVIGYKLDLIEDEIIDIFNYLTIKRNYCPIILDSPDVCIDLLDYKKDINSITLNLSKEFLNFEEDDLNTFITLLFESYHLIGYEELIINANGLIFSYEKEDIFKMNKYSNYIQKSNEGFISYIYYINGDYINFESILYDFYDEISYKMKKLYSNIEYEISSNSIILYYDEEVYDYDFLLKSLEYNFYGYDFTLIKL